MNIDLGDILALVIAISGFVIAWKKAPLEKIKMSSESRAITADAAEKFQQIANKAADRLDALESEMIQVRELLRQSELRAAKFENWAKRLSHQVHSLGYVPVPFEPETELGK
jgi:hypothetical protein